MNIRFITIVLILFGAIIVGASIWYFFFRGTQPTQGVPTGAQPGSILPVAGNNPTPVTTVPGGTDTMSLATTDGGKVMVQNFMSKSDTVADAVNRGYYILGPSTQSVTTMPPYLITYIASTQYFNIELLQEPIGQIRELAQQYLEQYLGISASDLCKINYTVSTPSSVNKTYGGASLGFSFCPGAVVLPK